MKSILLNISAALAFCLLAAQVAAQPAIPLSLPLTQREQATSIGAATKSEKLNWMRSTIRQGPYGQARLDRIFKNFEGENFIDPKIPGVGQSIRMAASYHPPHLKGAERTLLYGIKIFNDSRFQLVELDQRVTASGRTDKDLFFRHTQTGQRGRIEVKNVQPASQRADLERIKGQIDKMAAEYKRTGELQAWANRQETIPAIKEYARQKGVPTYEKTKQAEFTKVLDDFDRRSIVEARVKLAGGALSTGAGIALLYTSTRGLLDVAQSDANDLTTNLRIGEQSSLLAAGGGFTASGLAQLGSKFAITESAFAKLGSITKWGGRVGIVGVILGEGIGIGVDYYNWDEMTARQKATSKVQHSVSIGGMIVAFGAGCLIGIETGPGALAFGAAAAGATYAAARVATGMVEDSYNRLDDAQKEQVRTFIYQQHGVSQ